MSQSKLENVLERIIRCGENIIRPLATTRMWPVGDSNCQNGQRSQNPEELAHEAGADDHQEQAPEFGTPFASLKWKESLHIDVQPKATF